MVRDDDPHVGRVVTEEDTGCRARGKLVFGSGSHVGIAQIAEDAKVSVVGRLAIEQLIGNAVVNNGGGTPVEEVGRRGKGLDPVFGRHASMNEQGVNAIVEGPKNVLGFAILLGGVWARET